MSRLPSLGARGEGWVVLQLVGFGLLFAAVWLAPLETGLDPELAALTRAAGYLLGLGGAVLIGLGLGQLRRARALAAVPRPRAEAALVESGPYRWIRHPIYAGLILGAFGLALVTPWVGTFAAAALLAVILDLKRRREEAWLAEHFPGYLAYRRRTKALVPRVY